MSILFFFLKKNAYIISLSIICLIHQGTLV